MTRDQIRNVRSLERRALDSETMAIRFRRAAERIESLDQIELQALVGGISWSVATGDHDWLAIAHGIVGRGSTPTNAIASWLYEAARRESESARKILASCKELMEVVA